MRADNKLSYMHPDGSGRGRHTYGAVHVGSAEIHACMRRRSTRARTYTAYRERSKSSDRCAVVQVARCSSAEIYSEDVSSPRLPPIRCCANNDACRARRSTATSNLARRVFVPGSLHQIRSVRDPRSERPLVTCIWGGVSVTASVDRYGIEKVREQCKHRSTRAGGQLQLAPTLVQRLFPHQTNKQTGQPAAAADVRPRHRARGGRAKRRKRRVRTCARPCLARTRRPTVPMDERTDKLS
jgi:hypothetical protein